jgi:hypothetical protein
VTLTKERIIGMNVDLEQLYDEHIRPLPDAEQLRLVERIVEGIARHVDGQSSVISGRVLATKGVEPWSGVDAVAYVEELRNEWKQRT